MRRFLIGAVVCLLAASFALGREGQRVRVVVHVPSDTPLTGSVYFAGSLASVGNWRPDGVELHRQVDGTYTGDLDLQAGDDLEFKITRGGWDTVEVNGEGIDRPNRTITIDPSTTKIEVTVVRWANTGPRVSSLVGNLQVRKIESAVLKQTRTLRVWLPAGYEADANARYDVLYMHDGQNCFDRLTSAFDKEWQIDETLTRLIAEKSIEPIIVVGIDNVDRVNEYTYVAEGTQGGGNGAEYARFVLEEAKPFIEKNYRTKSGAAHTFLGGSSLGGLITLEIARRNPGVFGGLIVMSPALWWHKQALTENIEKDAGGLADTRIWMDIGTSESSDASGGESAAVRSKRFADEARRLDAALTAQHVEHRFVIDEGAVHDEIAWAKRFPAAITYLMTGK